MNGVSRRKLPAAKSKYMSVREVREHFGISDMHARNLIARGELESIRLGRRVLVTRASVEALEGQ